MEIEEKLKVYKDLKTAARLTKQCKTMYNNISNIMDIETRNGKSAVFIASVANSLEKICSDIENNTQTFKKEMSLGGYQLSLFDEEDF